MAERHRSKDGERESEKFLGPEVGTMQQGRAGGDLARRIATENEEKRRVRGDTSVTRVTKSCEEGQGDLDGHHGTKGGEELLT